MNSKIRFLSQIFSIAFVFYIIIPSFCLSMDINTKCHLILDNASCNLFYKDLRKINNGNQKKYISDVYRFLIKSPTKYYFTEILKEVYKIVSTENFLDKYGQVSFDKLGYMLAYEILDIFKSFTENYYNHCIENGTKNKTRKCFQFEHNYWNDDQNYFYFSYFGDWINGENENLKKHCECVHEYLLQSFKYIVRNINPCFSTQHISISCFDKSKMIINVI